MGKRKYFTEDERLAARRASNAKYYKKNKKKIAEYNAERYKTNREQILKRNNEYNQSHKTERAEYSAAYKAAHKDRYNDLQVEYRKTQIGRAFVLIENYKRRDRKCKRGECTIDAQWIVDNVFSGQSCHYCGESDWMKLGVDRIDNSLPHTPENVVPCCGVCNTKRHTTEYDEFMRLIGKIK